MKPCNTCLEVKDLSEFSYQKNTCKPCRSKKEVLRQKNDPNRKAYMTEYRKKNAKKIAAVKKLYRQKNRHKERVWTANRRAAFKRYPLSDKQKQEISYVYSVARDAEILTGNSYEVDHIIPLKGENISGLHVPWNLQVVPKEYNRSKYNKVELPAFSIGGRAQSVEV